MTVQLNADVRARLDAHLDAVEQALVAAGHSRERRRGVVDDLEAQILDMLARRAVSPGMQDLEAILAELDPPVAYGDSAVVSGNAHTSPDSQHKVTETDRVHSQPMSTLAQTAPVLTVSGKRSFDMKSAVCIALIICGALLVMTPAAYHYLNVRSEIDLIKTVPNMSLNPAFSELGNDYTIGLYLAGIVAGACGIVGGFMAFSSDSRGK